MRYRRIYTSSIIKALPVSSSMNVPWNWRFRIICHVHRLLTTTTQFFFHLHVEITIDKYRVVFVYLFSLRINDDSMSVCQFPLGGYPYRPTHTSADLFRTQASTVFLKLSTQCIIIRAKQLGSSPSRRHSSVSLSWRNVEWKSKSTGVIGGCRIAASKTVILDKLSGDLEHGATIDEEQKKKIPI